MFSAIRLLWWHLRQSPGLGLQMSKSHLLRFLCLIWLSSLFCWMFCSTIQVIWFRILDHSHHLSSIRSVDADLCLNRYDTPNYHQSAIPFCQSILIALTIITLNVSTHSTVIKRLSYVNQPKITFIYSETPGFFAYNPETTVTREATHLLSSQWINADFDS